MTGRVELLGVKAEVARGFVARSVGLIGRRSLPPGEGLLIPRCNCVHTMFMRFAIDLAFLDSRGEVVRRVENVRPWRLFVWGGWRARAVLETASRAGETEVRSPKSGTFVKMSKTKQEQP